MKYWEIRIENPGAKKVAALLERICPELKPAECLAGEATSGTCPVWRQTPLEIFATLPSHFT
jgi:hypothetical protein